MNNTPVCLQVVVPGAGEHPLQYNYTFWYSRRTPGRPASSQSYEQNIKQIGSFASVRTHTHTHTRLQEGSGQLCWAAEVYCIQLRKGQRNAWPLVRGELNSNLPERSLRPHLSLMLDWLNSSGFKGFRCACGHVTGHLKVVNR